MGYLGRRIVCLESGKYEIKSKMDVLEVIREVAKLSKLPDKNQRNGEFLYFPSPHGEGLGVRFILPFQ